MPDEQRFQAVIDKHLCKSFDVALAIEKEGAHELTVCYPVNSMITGDGVKENDTHPLGIGGETEPSFTLDVAGVHGVSSSGFVRRLTTVECARLQGFPDHHAEIPWKGKPAELCPKGPQYKAYGNAMCVNVIEWLGRVIEGELENERR